MKKTFFIIFGCISIVLGTLGVFLPVLPTTPFYLLAAWLFLKSSKRLYDKTMQHPFIGKIIRNYTENKAIPKRVKIISVSTLWATILLSAYLVDILWVRIVLLVVAIGVSWHLLSMKTLKE